MWPIGHASAAYLLYTALCRQRFDTGPTAIAAILVGFGAIFPDLVDKPLSWSAGILPTGRSLSHSLLVLVPVVLAVYLVARWYTDAEYGVAFGVGMVSHPLVDAFPALWDGGASWTFLLWPVLAVTPYDEAPT
ncbi:MAG: metal-dependent hydrolase, partial [Halovenus sp.]